MILDSAYERNNILIVDDTPANLQVLSQLLTAQGYRVRPSPSGSIALKSAQRQPPDLILLDIMMPEMDGYEVCRRLKEDERTNKVPVIFLSALSETFNKTRSFSVGAVDYIAKPFQAEEVLARVKTHLTLYGLQEYQRELIGRFASQEVADEVLEKGFSLGGRYVNASVLFADIRSFSTIAKAHSPEEVIELLNDYFKVIFSVIAAEDGVVAQIAGDGIMAIFGAPAPQDDHCLRAVRSAIEIVTQIAAFNRRRANDAKAVVEVGIGIASGRMIAGLVGAQNRAIYTCHGDTVNIAARLEEHTKQVAGSILIDERTRQEIGDSFQLEDRGLINLKGKQRPVQVYSVLVK
jgi:class 3 adenylate cyclase